LAWLSLAVKRRNKVARYADAMEARRRTMLKTGVTQLLAVAADLSQIRMKCAAQQGMLVCLLYHISAFHVRNVCLFVSIFKCTIKWALIREL